MKNRNKYVTPNEKIELSIYEFLGVEWFKKQTLNLEKIIHRKDKGYNINYHPKTNDLNGLKEYLKFLYYNGAIHVKNSIIYTIIIMISFLSPIHGFVLINIFSVPLLIVNLYCVMLQRYTGIRICSCIRAREEINKRKSSVKVQKIHELEREKCKSNIENIDPNLVNNFINFLQNKQDLILSIDDAEQLKMIKDYLSELYQNSSVEDEKSDSLIMQKKKK